MIPIKFKIGKQIDLISNIKKYIISNFGKKLNITK